MTIENLNPEEQGNEIMKQVGVLEEQTDGLSDISEACEVDKEEVASWITMIGRALFAIFKTQ